jgi:hypothetical protein
MKGDGQVFSGMPMEIGTVAQWAGATATFLAVLVALFKDEILRWWRKPKLTVLITLAPPDCHKTTLTYMVQQSAMTYRSANCDCYYLRLWVQNVGKIRAERVQVFVAKLFRRSADGSFKEVDGFLPMNLRWAHGQQASGGPEIFAEGISPEMGKHCDLGHIVDPRFRRDVREDLPGVPGNETIVALDLEVQPKTFTHLIPPGVYQLQLRVAAANCPPVTRTIELTITGKWFGEQAQMFSDGLGIRMIS